MIKTLRTPTVFCLLTIVIYGWLASWRINGTPFWISAHYGTLISSYRPMFHIAYGRFRFKRTNGQMPFSHGPPPFTRYAIQTESHLVVISVDRGKPHPTSHQGEAILAAGKIDKRTNTIEFGLLAPVGTFSTTQLSVRPIGTHPTLTLQEAHDGVGYPEPPGTYIADSALRSHWRWNRRAIIHDSLFFLTLIAWLISLTGIPRWIIWKRLTPAQRRRAKHQCPVCAYDLAGLTSTTCPECGNALSSSLTTPNQ